MGAETITTNMVVSRVPGCHDESALHYSLTLVVLSAGPAATVTLALVLVPYRRRRSALILLRGVAGDS